MTQSVIGATDRRSAAEPAGKGMRPFQTKLKLRRDVRSWPSSTLAVAQQFGRSFVWHATPSAASEPFAEFIGRPISQVLHRILRSS